MTSLLNLQIFAYIFEKKTPTVKNNNFLFLSFFLFQ